MNRKFIALMVVIVIIGIIAYGVPQVSSSLGPIGTIILFTLLIGLAAYFKRYL